MAGHLLNENDYKLLKQEFVTGFNGTTLIDIAIVVSSAPIATMLRHLTCIWLLSNTTPSTWLKFIIDFTTLQLPVFVSFTALGTMADAAIATFSMATLGLLCVMHKIQEPKHKMHHITRPKVSKASITEIAMTGKRPFITHFRAYVLIATAICILAVDFQVFPRKFCKAETFGTGLMDVGVGAVIFSNAIVSPAAREKSQTHKKIIRWTEQIAIHIDSIRKALVSSIPLLVLGLGRLLSVKATDYQEHVSEYGVHWNFFFTLAAVKVLSSILHCVLATSWSWLLAAVIACGYQYLLQQCGLQEFVLHGTDGTDSRNDLLEANREGIFSVLGYLALYFAAVQLGHYLMKPRSNLRDWLLCAIVMVIMDFIFWVLLYFVEIHLDPVSRRLANLPFVIWMLAYNFQLIVMFLLVELIQVLMHESGTAKYISKQGINSAHFCLLEAVNRNGLFYFLLANLLTGAVNQSMITMFAPPSLAYFVLTVYLLVLAAIVAVMHVKNITLRFW